jgi:hypothetical protein
MFENEGKKVLDVESNTEVEPTQITQEELNSAMVGFETKISSVYETVKKSNNITELSF